MSPSYGLSLKASIQGWLPSNWFGRFKVRANAKWTPQRLVFAALFMAWAADAALCDRFDTAGRLLRELFPWWPRGMTYTGFVNAWLRHHERVLPALAVRLRRRQTELAGERLLRCGWRAFAVDGSRFEAARSEANKKRLGCAGRKKTGPQCFLTMALDLASGLPWDFRIGAGTASERAHFEDMLDTLPPGALAIADADFVGYELWRAIADGGRHFLLRIGANVRLLQKLGVAVEEREDTMYLWPQDRRDEPPLVVRLVVLKRGKKKIYLATNVLDEAKLTAADAAELYALRWESEVGFRSIKQTLERRKLRSQAPAQAMAELSWAVLGLWVLGALAVESLLKAGKDPLSWSAAAARRTVRNAMKRAHRPARSVRALARELEGAVRDEYVRTGSKKRHDWPHKKREKPPGAPKIRPATTGEIQLAKRFAALAAA